MAMRGVYEWMMGVKPTLDGLILCPCLPKEFESPKVQFTYMGNPVTLCYIRGEGKTLVNGAEVTTKSTDRFSGKENFFIPLECFKDGENVIEYYLG